MTTLTKEHFDQHMTTLEKRFDSIDSRFDDVEQKIDLVDRKIDDEVAGPATMITKGSDDIAKRLDVRDRLETLEKKMTKVESALNVRL